MSEKYELVMPEEFYPWASRVIELAKDAGPHECARLMATLVARIDAHQRACGLDEDGLVLDYPLPGNSPYSIDYIEKVRKTA